MSMITRTKRSFIKFSMKQGRSLRLRNFPSKVRCVTILILSIFLRFMQRIIKVIKPLENTSIEFTKTIGDLYFQHKDYGNVISKKITYFLEVVRSRFYLNTNEIDDEFVKKLALKSGNNLEKTKELIQYIKQLKGKTFHTEQDLLTLNKLMEEFNI